MFEFEILNSKKMIDSAKILPGLYQLKANEFPTLQTHKGVSLTIQGNLFNSNKESETCNVIIV